MSLLYFPSQSAGGGGKILQVVSTTWNTDTDFVSADEDDTGLTLDITPAATTSKIFLMGSIGSTNRDSGSIATPPKFYLYRDSTLIGNGPSTGDPSFAFYFGYGTPLPAFHFLDSPSSTSSITYVVKITNASGVTTMINELGTASSITAMEVGA